MGLGTSSQSRLAGTAMSDEIPRCVALSDLEDVGDQWSRAKLCMREAQPRRPLCEAHFTILKFSDVMVLADDGSIYILTGGKAQET